MILARGRGRAAGFNFRTEIVAVAWDKGAWCLIYRMDEMIGGELRVDGQVIARVYRGEPRRALEQVVSSAGQVTLRLIFDDARYPDFDLDLWKTGDEAQRDAGAPSDAITEANRWLSRIEAILRRPVEPRVAARPPPPASPTQAPRPTSVQPPRQLDLLDDADN